MQTVLGDRILLPPRIPVDHQLHRCKKHKQYEGNLLSTLSKNSSFLDIGAHFGDTVLTMALLARRINRKDIRFVAFEPNKEKCDYIRIVNRLNNLNIVVFQKGVGEEICKIQEDIGIPACSGACSYKKIENGNISMIKLDDVRSQIEPVGMMHIDVEGWEAYVLKGATKILENNNPYLILECWSGDYSYSRGFSKCPEEDILNEMKKYNFERKDDLVDEERNLVFYPKIDL